MSFQSFGFIEPINQAIVKNNYLTPTPIQQKAIPHILNHKDVLASAQTGTGKTAAFCLPLLNLIGQSRPGHHQKSLSPDILILAPTRELANQIEKEVIQFSRYMRVNTLAITGGVSYNLQNRLLKNHLHFVIATPGRLMDLMRQNKIQLKHIKAMVIDEADRMLDMGFMPDIKKIYEATSNNQQMMMFTATLTPNIEKIAQNFLKNPVRVAAENKIEAHKNIKQYLYSVKNYEHKKQVLDEILKDEELNQAIVFTSTKRDADKLSRDLFTINHPSKALHGDLSQRQRTQIIDRFKDNKLKILVATDIAARGIDVKEVTHVINFDLPRKAEDYIHRIGRTGRAEKLGKAFSLVNTSDRPMIRKIEQYAKISMEFLTMKNDEPEKDFRSEPFKKSFKKKFSVKKKSNSFGSRRRNSASFPA